MATAHNQGEIIPISSMVFHIAVILMPHSCIAEAADLMQLINGSIINGRWDMEILQKQC